MCLRVASEVTLLEIPPCQIPMCGVAYSCSYVLLVLRKWIESQDPFRLYPSAFNPKDYRIPMETGVSRKIIFRVWAGGTTALGRSPTSSKAAALIFRVSVLFFEAKSHLHFVLAFTQQRWKWSPWWEYKEQFARLLLHALFAEKGRPYRISYDVVAKSLHCMQKRASVLRKWIESPRDPFRFYPSAFNPKDYRIPMETGVSRKIILCVWASGATALGRSPTSSNAKDYFTGYARFHGNSIIFWIKSGWIQSERVLRFYPLA